MQQKNKGVVYKITNPEGKSYIGCTTNYNNRMSMYRNGHQCSSKVDDSIKAFGFHNHSVDILWEGSQEEMYEIECKLITEHNTVEDGLNIRYGKHNKKYNFTKQDSLTNAIYSHLKP